MTDVRDGPVVGMGQIGATAWHDFNSTIDGISRSLLDAIDIRLNIDDISRIVSIGTIRPLYWRCS